MKVYLDNAASSPILPEVVEAMQQALVKYSGNPSSVHGPGRVSRNAIEQSRKCVAQHLNCSIGEIFFTSGGTESNNMAIKTAVRDLGVTDIISSPIEHKCVINSIKYLCDHHQVKLHLVEIDEFGEVDYSDLEEKLSSLSNKKSLVCLMHANNEVGTLNDIQRIGKLCRTYQSYFHSDTIQSFAHLPLNIEELEIDFLTASGHKFHGPKGIGVIYINGDLSIKPLIDGGGQERNMRAGTENIYGIVGLQTALEAAIDQLEEHRLIILEIRSYFKTLLTDRISNISFIGQQTDGRYLFTILNVLFPPSPKTSLLSLLLDIKGIAVSGGSACSSGTEGPSYVIQALNKPADHKAIRFSFSHLNTREEIDYVVNVLEEIFEPILAV